MNEPRCRLCASHRLVDVVEFALLPRVTSDCRPWNAGGRLAYCADCGFVQKPLDAALRAELASLYAEYRVYAQGAGREQRAKDPQSGALDPRSAQILRNFLRDSRPPSRGRWLDVGCGNGAMLAAVSQALPGWKLCGTELDERNRASLDAIPGFDFLHTGALEELEGPFDAISLVYVLEHLEDPVRLLQQLRPLAAPGAEIFVQVPRCAGNYFDLTVADHVSHFDELSLRRCFEAAGVAPTRSGTGFLERECFAAGCFRAHAVELGITEPPQTDAPLARSQVEWLARVAEYAASLSAERGVGLFGSSIGAAFAYAVREGGVAFFLDEDPDRIGRSHLGVPIRAPEDVPPGAIVYVPLPPQLARAVTGTPGREHWLIPPPYDSIFAQKVS